MQGEKSQSEVAPFSSIGLSGGWFPLLASGLFVLIAVAFIPYAGIQNDEALFAGPLWLDPGGEFRIRLFHTNIPLMVMSYIGTLKTLLYWPVFALFGTGVWALRLPAVILGAAAVYVFYRFLAESVGHTPARWGAILLATEPTFLLTATFDWGPVVLEHLLLLLGCWCLYRFATQDGTRKDLAWGALCLGLALWNKAIFVWALSGLGVATVLVFPGPLRTLLTIHNIRRFALFFLLGCLPLLVYNAKNRNATMGQNAHVDNWATVRSKWVHLEKSMTGDPLFGYLVSEEWTENPKAVTDPLGRASAWVRERVGERRDTYFHYAFGFALVALSPWWWRRRGAWFALVFAAVTWLAMALTHDAGGSAHHLILLWPFPVVFFVVAWQAGPLRKVTWLVSILLILLNLSVLNQYYLQIRRNGPGPVFTDAYFPLLSLLNTEPQRHLYAIDWGLYDGLVLSSKGKFDQRNRFDELTAPEPSPEQKKHIEEMLRDPQGWIINHVPGRELYPEPGKRLESAAAVLGLHKRSVELVADSNGRPVFEVFRYE